MGFTSKIRYLADHVRRVLFVEWRTPEKQAQETKKRGKELSRFLLQRRKHRMVQLDIDGHHIEIPERWLSTTFDDLLAYHLRANDPRTVNTLPDKAWGLLDEATNYFAEDGHQLRASDIDALRALASPQENIHVLSLAELCQRHCEKQHAKKHLVLQTKKLRGSS